MKRRLKACLRLLLSRHYVLYTMGKDTEDGYRDIHTDDKNFLQQIEYEIGRMSELPMY